MIRATIPASWRLISTFAFMASVGLRWTGAGRIPAHGFGYLQATVPLVVVEKAGPRLTVRLRPALMARLVGARTLTAAAGDALQVFPVRSNAGYQGIEFRPPLRSSFYFFTSQRDAVLAALAGAGFAVFHGKGESAQSGISRPMNDRLSRNLRRGIGLNAHSY